LSSIAGTYTGFSIDPPQPAQTWSWLSRIRTIVECSPHVGQYPISWNRTRQFTQRYRPASWVGRSQGSPQLGHVRSGPNMSPVPG
jgi:hypothetical protein